MDIDAQVAARPDLFTGLYRVGEPRRALSAVTYQVETLKTSRVDCLPLVEAHYQEIAQFKDVQKLDPDWETYEALERSGALWIMTVRSEGNMVGYFVMTIGRARHYKTLLMACEDMHYLLPAYRKGMAGYLLIRKTLRAMKERGCKLVTLRCKAGMSHAVLFERLDGELTDLVYAFKL